MRPASAWYTLGPHLVGFLRSPLVSGHPSWIALGATVASVALALPVVAPWALARVGDLRAGRVPQRVRASRETAFTEGAAIGAFGLLLTATLLTVFRHYLIVVYPLQWVWLSRLVLRRPRGRALLAGLWIAQLVISLSFLNYIHDHHGAEGGEYGRSYRWQVESTTAPR